MIRVEHDPQFWIDIASHPAVIGTLYGLDPQTIGAVAQQDNCTPLASENGGFLVVDFGAFGAIREFHTLFKPEGWGREVHDAAKEAIRGQFASTTLMLSTFEMLDNRRSRPPLSFGFERLGTVETPVGPAVHWILTKAAWEASPAARR